MSTAVLSRPLQGVLRDSSWDALLVALASAQGLLLLAVPSAAVVAIGLWWNSNTVAHYFIHRPFFRSLVVNRFFSLYLSILLGVPQTMWRERHLAHHAGVAHRWRWSRQLFVETLAVLLLWGLLVCWRPSFFLTAYLPGYLIGLALCFLHGHFEHVHGTVSHHGMLYNLLFFNDGYHVEHHAHPGEHWTRLPSHVQTDRPCSRWPAVLRWLELLSLDSLERLVLHSRLLQRFVLARHELAFRAVLPDCVSIRRVLIVGGGLYPRTLLVLQRVLPGASLTVLDGNRDNIESASRIAEHGVSWVQGWYAPERAAGFDLIVFPLAYRGERQGIYARPPAPLVILHDWLWRRRGVGVVVSWLLFKRLNLVRP
jgi:hypothetical protein